jgi:predicted Fe-Mo cluster-binding NifX family protein
MKIAVTSTGTSLDSEVDPRFGRCQYFVVVDPETMQFEVLDNSGASAGGGAGIATAQRVAGKGVDAVLTGNCGPNAHEALSAAGIKVITGATGKVREAVQGYKSGNLKASSQPNVSPHFGMSKGEGH